MAQELSRWRFGTAEFDQARFELRVAGRPVPLQHKPLEMLALLLCRAGEVVDKDALLDEVWSGAEVGPAVIANAASKLRLALGAENAGFIATVPRKGYRLDGRVERAPVTRHPPQVLQAGHTVPGAAGHRLQHRLRHGERFETWLAEHPKTGKRHIFKFVLDDAHVSELSREVQLMRLLRKRLGNRADLARWVAARLDAPPYWLEYEYAGESLDVWAGNDGEAESRLSRMTPEERLAIVLQIADALSAAHRAQVLHGALQPGNVLMHATGPGWQIKLIGFAGGAVPSPEQTEPCRDASLHAATCSAGNTQASPHHMAPELLTGAHPSPASDLYSLGVLAYQLFAGELRQPQLWDWEARIGEGLLREDIAAATHSNPAQRPSSVAEFADRLRRLAERNAERRALRMAAELEQKQREMGVLARRNEVAEALNRLLRDDLIGAANPALSGRADITVAEALSTAAERIDTRYGALPAAIRATLHEAMQLALAELSRATDAVQAGHRALAAMAQCMAGEEVPVDERALCAKRTQDVRLRLALDLVQLSHLDEARAVVDGLEAGLAEAAPGNPEFRARLLYVKSWLVSGDSSFDQSMQPLEEAFALVEPLNEDSAPWRDKIMFGLADNLRLLGRHAQAEALYRRLHDEQTRRWGTNHIRPLYTLVGLGGVLAQAGRLEEAQAFLEQARRGLNSFLGPQHRQTLTALEMLADVHFKQGRWDQAAAEWATVHDGYALLLGENSSYVATARINQAMALHRAGRPAKAVPLLRAALAAVGAFASMEAPQAQLVRFALADSLADLGQWEEAQALCAGLDARQLDLARPDHHWEARLRRIHGLDSGSPEPA